MTTGQQPIKIKPKGSQIALTGSVNLAGVEEVAITRSDLNKAVAAADESIKVFIDATGAV